MKVATVHTAAKAASPNSGVAEMAAEIESQSSAAVEIVGTHPLGKILIGTGHTQNLYSGSPARTFLWPFRAQVPFTCTGHDSDTVLKVLCDMHTRVGKIRLDSVRTPSSLANRKKGQFHPIRIK